MLFSFLIAVASSAAVVTAQHKVLCSVSQFVSCQLAFQASLGIQNSQADWHNPNELIGAVVNTYIKGSVNGQHSLTSTCNSYNTFLSCLGPMAPACVNPYYLILNDKTPNNAWNYMGTMSWIGFNCGAGFLPSYYNWPCMQRVFQHYYNDTLIPCITSFTAAATSDPTNTCSYMNQLLSCWSLPFLSTCNGETKWEQCEAIRVYFGQQFYQCLPSTFCSVNTNSRELEYLKQHPELKIDQEKLGVREPTEIDTHEISA